MAPKKILAIIPARAGSKRLPRKNIINFCGKPLIAWTIEAALKSHNVSRVIVSTDSLEIAEIAKKYGAEVPFLRAKELSQDESSSISVVLNVLEEIKEHYTHVALLQPTSPLRTEKHIDESIELLGDKSGVISVSPLEHPIEWTNTLQESMHMDGFIKPEYKNKRSQDFPKRYRINGAIYVIKTEILKNEKNFIPEKNAVAYVMDPEQSVDIDTKNDLAHAMVNRLGFESVFEKVAERVN